ncbi:MAG: hypothetical protein EPO31_16010 [Gammaproteobacteria bacterium]|nr:MAG: hypothetical protein EPO31_16010 [Gammaproteobacteria bacterium]
MRPLLIILGLLISIDAFADAKAGEKKAQLCLLCHKPENVKYGAPLLEAQSTKYLVRATTEYKIGKRSDPIMKSSVANLSSRDIRNIADYIASRPAVTGVFSTDPAKVAVGEKWVVEMKCGSCHGPTFAGTEAVPRLAGQITGYLISQLEAFAADRRAHPPIGTRFDRIGDVEAIAHYLTAMK